VGQSIFTRRPVGVGAGSTAPRRARYHLFRLAHNANGLDLFLTVCVYSPRERRFVDEREQRIELPQFVDRVS